MWERQPLATSVHDRNRHEFQSWAHKVAQQHSYDVEFAGIGRADEEAKALGSTPNEAGVGCASQVAICATLVLTSMLC